MPCNHLIECGTTPESRNGETKKSNPRHKNLVSKCLLFTSRNKNRQCPTQSLHPQWTFGSFLLGVRLAQQGNLHRNLGHRADSYIVKITTQGGLHGTY